jgi:hypothetical protein
MRSTNLAYSSDGMASDRFVDGRCIVGEQTQPLGHSRFGELQTTLQVAVLISTARLRHSLL